MPLGEGCNSCLYFPQVGIVILVSLKWMNLVGLIPEVIKTLLPLLVLLINSRYICGDPSPLNSVL